MTSVVMTHCSEHMHILNHTRKDMSDTMETQTFRRLMGLKAHQSCPGMVGPGQNGEYYCFSREYGYCDQSSGLCICNHGYAGLSCTACQSGFLKQGGLCYAKSKKPVPTIVRKAGNVIIPRDCAHVIPHEVSCVSCEQYDPRCLQCDLHGCLKCADLQLNSVRRSGQRQIDQPLPNDELIREFSQTFVYGSQDPRVFDEAESYTLAPASYTLLPLNESSVACIQGSNANSEWVCASFSESHRVCGHRGVFSFESPLYATTEAAGNLTVTVKRSGGGLGRAVLLYDIEHITTTPGDVSPTMFYTSSQRLDFAPGVVSLAFKIQIHDNHHINGNNSFKLRLREPFAPTDELNLAPATLGNQWRTFVTIVDDDSSRPVANLSHVVDPESTLLKGGTAGIQMSFQIHSVLGSGVPGLDPSNEALFHITSYAIEDDSSFDAAIFRPLKHGTITQCGGPDKSLLTCTWMRENSGNYSVAIQLLYPGGLRGDYFKDAWLGEHIAKSTPQVSHIDRHINFTWNTGPAFIGARGHYSARWSGWLKPVTSETIIIAISVVGYARLWVDDSLVIDRWDAGGEINNNFPVIKAKAGIALDVAELHSLVLEYRAPRQGKFHAQLLWKCVSNGKMEVIPAHQLYSGSHIRDSPFTNVLVTPALTASPESSTSSFNADHLSMSALEVFAGKTFTLSIFPRDDFGNRRRSRDQSGLQHDVISATLTLATEQSSGVQSTRTEDALLMWDPKPDVFRVVLRPQVSGDYFLTIILNNVSLAANPFEVTVLPAQLNPAQCVLSGPGLQIGRVAGQTVIVELEARDMYANRIFTGNLNNLNLQASRLDSTVPIVAMGQVVDNADGTYRIMYTPRVVGSYSVSVTWNGVHLHNSPYAITVVPNIAVGSTSSAEGPGIVFAKTNVQTSFEVTSRDSSGNNVLSGGGASTLVVVLEFLGKNNVSGSACTDLLNGHYTCIYTAHYVGITRLHVILADQAVIGSPFLVNVTAGPALGSRCVASGDGLVSSTAGQRTQFIVSIYDTFGNEKADAGNESIDVTFTGPDSVLTTVNADVIISYVAAGAYHVAYTLNRKGSYKISVSVDGVAVVSSPFNVCIYPNVVSSTTTSLDLLYPDLLTTLVDPPLVFRAGALIKLRLTTRDAFGNVLDDGVEFIHLNDAERAFLDAPIIDEKNGSYLITLRPLQKGVFSSFIPTLMVPGSVNGSYYSVSKVPVKSAPAEISPDHSLVLKRQDAAIAFDFSARPPFRTHSATTFSVCWNGFVLPLFSEIYTLELHALGSASLRIGSTKVNVQDGATRASHLIRLTARALVYFELNFSKSDQVAGSSVNLTWSSLSQSREIIPSSQLYTSWNIVNNVPLLNIKPAAADPTMFTPKFGASAQIRGSVAVQAVVDESLDFDVVARDSFGNELEDNAECTLFVLLPQVHNEVDLSISEVYNGSYKVTLIPHVTGEFLLYIAAIPDAMKAKVPSGNDVLVAFLAPFNIKGSPFQLDIEPGPPNAATSTLNGGGFVLTSAGVLTSFELELRDSSSNCLTAFMLTSYFDQIRVKLRSLSTGVEVYANVFQISGELQSVLSASRVRVEYIATIAGLHALLLSVDKGKFYEQKTATLQVYPSAATASTSFLSPNGAGAAATNTGLGPQIVTQKVQTYHVTVRDTFGNIRAKGGDYLVSRIHGPDSSTGNITDLGNGDYIVSYRTMLPGAYEIETLVAEPQHGLTGYYYVDTKTFYRNLAPTVRFVDTTIDFDWSKNESMRGYPRIVWRGFLCPSFTEEYMLWVNVQSDIGSAAGIYIDGKAVIDGLNTNAISGRVMLVSNRLHAIVVEYHSASLQQKPGYLSLFWQSARQPSQLIPTQSLFAGATEILPRTQLVAVN
ncbi:Actin-binding cytoskeleton protein, filamin [Plasmopara halstedii]|uniref:Actin-binding cytoskeleton protein, filamin n=1 Tax=Plasmopara halstedii TaxID=4781 RepID=A0A0P1AY66_PLAHL|nr:Actin-binding cytoskeleton protein, filamin [Plasmopara halstedii]CEG45777.1 Actin-binding cytoskeleton protein, filamin [Plasmopara halstedii]|eukprot:XP_024582146.1 Actin-binding cytoskeleton protein, filamin [Plasmopara halstedii]